MTTIHPIFLRYGVVVSKHDLALLTRVPGEDCLVETDYGWELRGPTEDFARRWGDQLLAAGRKIITYVSDKPIPANFNDKATARRS